MPEDSRTQAEEIVVRFKTTKPRGLLLATSFENSADRLQIYLDEGKAQMLIHIGDQEKVRLRDFTVVCEKRKLVLNRHKHKPSLGMIQC